MTAALRALMSGVIDYAGLFPPAKLPLEDAVREYLAIRESPEAWMLGRFVIRAGDIDQLEFWAEEWNVGSGLQLALVGRPSYSVGDCCANLHEDLYALPEFVFGAITSRCNVSLELSLPESLGEGDVSRMELADFFEAIQEPLDETGVLFDAVFLENLASSNSSTSNQSLISVIPHIPFAGFKFRTGGVNPDAFPTVEQLAAVVHAGELHQCLWKATAGLHHPLRHSDPSLGVKMHGFLNVLFAAVLANAHSLPKSEIAEILADEDAANFHVTDDGIRWREYTASVAQIESTRRHTFQSFGSCSFTEPRDDLRRLGLL